MSWTKKNVHPGKIISSSQEVDVDGAGRGREKRRISLGLKQVMNNPWEAFMAEHPIGTNIEGEVRGITEFGLFVGLGPDLDGMVHINDIDWNVPGEEAIKKYNKGDAVQARKSLISTSRRNASRWASSSSARTRPSRSICARTRSSPRP
jgi:small subunit ribosomal protein S1